MSILLELELSLAQLLLPTYFKSILDLGIKLPGFFSRELNCQAFFSQLYWELNCQAYFFPDLILDLYKCQHSSSLVSSIKKRIFVIFERVPLPQPGFEPGTFHTEGECLIHYSIEEVMLRRVRKDN